jgi:hypothetical protein
VSISTNSQEKPVLDPESFQRLLAAAFMLQLQNDLRNEKLTLEGSPRVRAIQSVIQRRTPSLRHSSRQWSRLKPFFAIANPKLWRTVEALAVAAVFCTMISLSLRRVTPLLAEASKAPMAEVRTIGSNMPPAAEVLGHPQTHAATLNSRPPIDDREADIVAKDVVIRYDGGAKNLPNNRPLTDLKRRRSENAGLQTGVRHTFGTDTATLAADTVVRYGAPLAAGARPQEHPKTDY